MIIKSGKQSIERAEHLKDIDKPMLFLSGTRDKLAELNLLNSVCGNLGVGTSLHSIDTADHSFKVLKRKRTTNEDVYKETALIAKKWITKIL